ncbi:hypothetical protein Q4E93_02635 [Flavitalea sp. BT771]|uniref:hypothetical protein n=1 Tax=Flavitalea sp. BT771 TaxID=3063329 RepID=UPI0026E1CBF6|nr:hypothetical protein [Flavitalea sp. BT771]MDO6429468.1 hypothetical protein [Flavitalea sp. BT771]MDV6218404.1 hypothetical protein [Flavitalea sp. BT771]
MYLLRFIVIISVYVSTGAYTLYSSNPVKSKWLVDRTSSISIAGSTNVNRFCCQVNEYTGPDTITLNPAGASFLGTLSVNIEDFNCNNRIMTGEFKRTLKYHDYPRLTIRFISLEKMPSFGVAAESVKGSVEVELAGISRKFEVMYSACRKNEGNVELVGYRVFGFSDFGLVPPHKMGGLIRVNDKLDVQFRLQLHQINQ